MKKIVALIIAAGICAAALPAAACTRENERTSYDITCSYDEQSRTLTAECAVDYKNTGAETETVKFNLYANAYREGALYKPVSDELTQKAFYNGTSYGEMEITGVTGGEWSLGGEDENILEVTLPEPLKALTQ